jgi:ribosome-associated translation inhibitor RaiA
MRNPVQITYRGLPHSEALDQSIQERALRLERAQPDITACHVTVELPHHHHQRGNHYRVQIFLALPRANLVVSRGDTANPAYEDVHVVIRDAFNAALRRLEERGRRLRDKRDARERKAFDGYALRRPA